MSKQRVRLFTSIGLLGVLSTAGWTARPRAAAADREFTQQERQFWSLQKVAPVTPPAISHRQWVSTPIDAFILSRLEAKKISPAPRAEKITLLRRAYLDLVGVPPTHDETTKFLADKDEKKREKLVDKLLADYDGRKAVANG